MTHPLDFADEFPLAPDLLYLNHAAVAPWPRRTAQAVQAFATENLHQGARDYPRWMQREAQLRNQLGRLLNAPPGTIALLKNTSEALSVVAYGLDWQAGDNIVSSNQEFPSNRIVWESLHHQGVSLRTADLQGDDPEAALFAQVDSRTRLLAVSSVQYASGLRLDLLKIGAFCQARGILFCVDAIQSLGALAIDVQAAQIDFLMADGHKWLLGPEGLAVFYCRDAISTRLRLQQYGWHMVEDFLNFDRADWEPAHSARRFECGSPNMLGIYALSASLSLFEELGMATVEHQLLANTRYLLDTLQAHPEIELLSAHSPGRYAGIVTFRHRHHSNDALFQRLSAAQVICAKRGGGIRFSPHFYTPPAVLDNALAQVFQA